MPRNTYEDDTGPAVGVYEDVHVTLFVLSSQWHAGPTCKHLLPPLILPPSSSHACGEGNGSGDGELTGGTRSSRPRRTRSGSAWTWHSGRSRLARSSRPGHLAGALLAIPLTDVVEGARASVACKNSRALV
jgi:hypothetical protein